MLKRICARCGKLHNVNEKCPLPETRHKDYDRYKRDKKSKAFYESSAWRKLQEKIKIKAHGLDMYQMKVNNQLEKGYIVHHIYPLKERPDLKLKEGNLIYVSNETHNRIHSIYDKSTEDKEKLQKILQRIVDTW